MKYTVIGRRANESEFTVEAAIELLNAAITEIEAPNIRVARERISWILKEYVDILLQDQSQENRCIEIYRAKFSIKPRSKARVAAIREYSIIDPKFIFMKKSNGRI